MNDQNENKMQCRRIHRENMVYVTISNDCAYICIIIKIESKYSIELFAAKEKMHKIFRTTIDDEINKVYFSDGNTYMCVTSKTGSMYLLNKKGKMIHQVKHLHSIKKKKEALSSCSKKNILTKKDKICNDMIQYTPTINVGLHKQLSILDFFKKAVAENTEGISGKGTNSETCTKGREPIMEIETNLNVKKKESKIEIHTYSGNKSDKDNYNIGKSRAKHIQKKNGNTNEVRFLKNKKKKRTPNSKNIISYLSMKQPRDKENIKAEENKLFESNINEDMEEEPIHFEIINIHWICSENEQKYKLNLIENAEDVQHNDLQWSCETMRNLFSDLHIIHSVDEMLNIICTLNLSVIIWKYNIVQHIYDNIDSFPDIQKVIMESLNEQFLKKRKKKETCWWNVEKPRVLMRRIDYGNKSLQRKKRPMYNDYNSLICSKQNYNILHRNKENGNNDMTKIRTYIRKHWCCHWKDTNVILKRIFHNIIIDVKKSFVTNEQIYIMFQYHISATKKKYLRMHNLYYKRNTPSNKKKTNSEVDIIKIHHNKSKVKKTNQTKWNSCFIGLQKNKTFSEENGSSIETILKNLSCSSSTILKIFAMYKNVSYLYSQCEGHKKVFNIYEDIVQLEEENKSQYYKDRMVVFFSNIIQSRRDCCEENLYEMFFKTLEFYDIYHYYRTVQSLVDNRMVACACKLRKFFKREFIEKDRIRNQHPNWIDNEEDKDHKEYMKKLLNIEKIIQSDYVKITSKSFKYSGMFSFSHEPCRKPLEKNSKCEQASKDSSFDSIENTAKRTYNQIYKIDPSTYETKQQDFVKKRRLTEKPFTQEANRITRKFYIVRKNNLCNKCMKEIQENRMNIFYLNLKLNYEMKRKEIQYTQDEIYEMLIQECHSMCNEKTIPLNLLLLLQEIGYRELNMYITQFKNLVCYFEKTFIQKTKGYLKTLSNAISLCKSICKKLDIPSKKFFLQQIENLHEDITKATKHFQSFLNLQQGLLTFVFVMELLVLINRNVFFKNFPNYEKVFANHKILEGLMDCHLIQPCKIDFTVVDSHIHQEQIEQNEFFKTLNKIHYKLINTLKSLGDHKNVDSLYYVSMLEMKETYRHSYITLPTRTKKNQHTKKSNPIGDFFLNTVSKVYPFYVCTSDQYSFLSIKEYYQVEKSFNVMYRKTISISITPFSLIHIVAASKKHIYLVSSADDKINITQISMKNTYDKNDKEQKLNCKKNQTKERFWKSTSLQSYIPDSDKCYKIKIEHLWHSLITYCGEDVCLVLYK